MSVAIGDKIRILAVDEDDVFGIFEANGFVEGAVGEVIEPTEYLAGFLTEDDVFVVRFAETDEGEGFFFYDREEGSIWERV